LALLLSDGGIVGARYAVGAAAEVGDALPAQLHHLVRKLQQRLGLRIQQSMLSNSLHQRKAAVTSAARAIFEVVTRRAAYSS